MNCTVSSHRALKSNLMFSRQKIIEEAPVIVARPEIFKQMEEAAVRLAEMVGYRSTGTVEYLFDDDGNW